jgi:hypothetical protein
MRSRTVASLATAAALLGGCGGVARDTDLRTGSLTGTVSSVGETFCLARDEAKGFCLAGADEGGSHVGDCVTVAVTWIRSQSADESPSGVTGVTPAEASGHPGDCPPTRPTSSSER